MRFRARIQRVIVSIASMFASLLFMSAHPSVLSFAASAAFAADEPLDEATIKVRIESFTTLIGTARDEGERGRFLLSRAALYLQSREAGRDRPSPQAILRARADIREAMKIAALGPEERAHAGDLEGIAAAAAEGGKAEESGVPKVSEVSSSDSPRASAEKLRLAQRLMRNGDFEQAEKIVADIPSFERVLAKLGSGRPVAMDEFEKMSSEKREGIFSILALTQPRVVLEYLSAHKNESHATRKVGYLALQIERRKIGPPVSADLRLALGGAVPASSPSRMIASTVRRAKGPAKSEEMASAVRFPDSSVTASAASLTKTIESVRQVRAQVTRDLGQIAQGSSADVKKRILETAARLEEKMAVWIERSASVIPHSTEVAKEFWDQSDSFQAMLASVVGEGPKSGKTAGEKGMGGSKGQYPRRMPAFGALKSWPWPKTPVREIVNAMIRANKITAALLMLELLRSEQALSESDYFALRTGCLFALPDSEPLRAYIYSELKDARQDKLIAAWRKA